MKRFLIMCIAVGFVAACLAPIMAQDEKPAKGKPIIKIDKADKKKPVPNRFRSRGKTKDITVTGRIVVKMVVLVDKDGNEVRLPYARPRNKRGKPDQTKPMDPKEYVGKTVTITGKGWVREDQKGNKRTQIRTITSIKEASE